MRAQRCKGTRDLSSEEMGQFRLIEGIFRESASATLLQELIVPDGARRNTLRATRQLGYTDQENITVIYAWA